MIGNTFLNIKDLQRDMVRRPVLFKLKRKENQEKNPYTDHFIFVN